MALSEPQIRTILKERLSKQHSLSVGTIEELDEHTSVAVIMDFNDTSVLTVCVDRDDGAIVDWH